MNNGDVELVLNHLRLAIRMAVIIFPLMFGSGVASGWFLAHWSKMPVAAGSSVAIFTLWAIWLARLYYRTRGLCATPTPLPVAKL